MTFAEKIAALESDIVQIKAAQTVLQLLIARNNEESDGNCMLCSAEVLLREAVMHYEEEIATLKGPEADA